MRNYLILSSGAHVAFVAAWLFSGALMPKPKMGYYAIDLGGSLPAGGSVKGETAVKEPAEEPVSKAPPAPPAPKQVEERKLPANEVIRLKGKAKIAQPKPVPEKRRGINLKAALGVLEGKGGAGSGSRSGSGSGAGSGAAVTGDAGPAFPYPWYLKAIADRLDKNWKPPREFQSDTVCQIGFTISRDGQVSAAQIEKPSGDTLFDQLAQRAVLYSNPLPPLPEGFPDSTLRVHMKFEGKSY